ncbi:MAG: adenylosuccinate lyase [Planctomycetota bacterium]
MARTKRGRAAAVKPQDTYEHPLATRYASAEMIRLWSSQTRCTTWRKIWVAAALAQRELGLPIKAGQIRAMTNAIEDIDFKAAARYERRLRHDVMAHIHAFADAAPSARPIIHLGMTSMDVVDNADLMLMRQAFELLERRLVGVIRSLARFCEQYADLPALGFTHLQPAQLTTLGKRGTLWLNDLVGDLRNWSKTRRGLLCRGLRGATGTQASFLKLLGTAARVQKMERIFARQLDFKKCYPVTGQTYSRKVDLEVLTVLGTFAAGVHKICNDLRLLSMLKAIDEPFENKQVGSSSMPYKRNPMRAERATGLARFLMSLVTSAYNTLAAQMLERTLDDSSNKRLVMPQAFLTADALAMLLQNIFDGLVVYPASLATHIRAELPFIASEDILMAGVAAGGDRQDLHERIRQHSQAAGEQVKTHGRPNDLIERLKADEAFAGIKWQRVLDPQRYIGLAPQQTREFLRRVVAPVLRKYERTKPPQADLHV